MSSCSIFNDFFKSETHGPKKLDGGPNWAEIENVNFWKMWFLSVVTKLQETSARPKMTFQGVSVFWEYSLHISLSLKYHGAYLGVNIWAEIWPFLLIYARNAPKSRFLPLFHVFFVLLKDRWFRPDPIMLNMHYRFVFDAFRPTQSGPKHYKVIG